MVIDTYEDRRFGAALGVGLSILLAFLLKISVGVNLGNVCRIINLNS